ncbi:Predicted RNA binding protein YcfA, dsRBD-like fold, HicA-like mRNA interferase family [Pseudomonas sp. 43mfcvi1.1]|nr:type II toxin-antitoxin system HicA family toxin [Pseudomonas fluorescens]PWJ30559.1 putative RNA binding protein YcfA (HicA-like mRNA interferase family) [Pseudomonas sp. 43mfcvi1.1]SSB99236.1 Predicted RNA binding protein YcfA, dsRBD-like fold, HicA-like mRNA interferase family [Pseudomonas sp. 43mfcvi1.1]
MNSRFLISQIIADGWYLVRVRDSHHHFRHPTKPGLVTVPHPKKDLLKKTAISILQQALLQPARCATFPEDDEYALPDCDFHGR